jgi:hypothetical protein
LDAWTVQLLEKGGGRMNVELSFDSVLESENLL